MVNDSQPTKSKQKPDKMKKENSVDELTFSYVFDCLNEITSAERFLGFTLSADYSDEIKSKTEELLNLRYYFEAEVLKAILVYRVHQQKEPVIKWTEREAMEAYLKLNGAQ